MKHTINSVVKTTVVFYDKRTISTFLLCIFLTFFSLLSHSQKKDISLEDIFKNNILKAQRIGNIHNMKNVRKYTLANEKGTSIDVYNYGDTEKEYSIFDANNFSEINNFSEYFFSEDEKLILLSTDQERIYRHSRLAKHFIYNISDKTIEALSQEKEIAPKFSPDGKKIAFVRDNNIFVKTLNTKLETQITFDGKKNSVINGIADWVYEEEFSFVRAFKWSNDSRKVAFIRFDEANVLEFSMDIFGKGTYPTQTKIKYPKAGSENSKVSVHVYDLEKSKTFKVDLSDYTDFYVPRIYWTSENDKLCVLVMNRHQNKIDFLFVDTDQKRQEVVFVDTDLSYIELEMDVFFLPDNSFIWPSDRSGWNHLYLFENKNKKIRQITSGDWEVTKFYGYNSGQIYYQSTRDDEGNEGINRHVYSIDISGNNNKRLSKNTGVNRAFFSSDFTHFINEYSSVDIPYSYDLYNNKGEFIKKIKDNKELENNLKDYKISKKSIFTIKTDGGYDLNASMIKPYNFDSKKMYPVLFDVYGGPGSQKVSNSWKNDLWHQFLSQKGFIVVSVDNRGTGFKGRDFKKITYKKLGKYEIEDQIYAAKYFRELPFVKRDNIGFFGWSYGGYMASLAITKGADVFSTAIAVAPVTSWYFYDTIYTERYMGLPKENIRGYEDNTPFKYLDNFKGKYLLIHGSADDNVHYQNSMTMVEHLVQKNKQFDLFVYPDKNHGIYGGNTTLHLFTKITDFILNNLK
ncbi:S9 family peptidase [Ichthyobacterium seriolicida]|nr:S9 family peptidase [Ichthyobacterium seriolicida]